MKTMITLSLLSILLLPTIVQAKCNDPVTGSDGSDPDTEVTQTKSKSSGQRALEERPYNPTIKKGNDPVWGSDGSEPDAEIVDKQ